MANNDILRRLRYTFELSDQKMVDIFAQSEWEVTKSQIRNWLLNSTEADFAPLSDQELAGFLDGFITENRGKKEGMKPFPPIEKLNNNIILRKLKIALNLNEEATLEIYTLANRRISKHELSSFFRNPKQPQYRECKDQFLRNFLQGLQNKYRPGKSVQSRLSKRK